MNVASSLARKAELKAGAERLLNASIAAKKEIAGVELEQYNAHLAEIKSISAALDRHAELATFSTDATLEAVRRPILFGDDAAPKRGSSVTSVLREALKFAKPEEREQIQALAGYLGGRMSASADLRPSADGAVVIPSFVQQTLERNYAQFAPVVSVARLFPTDTGANTTFPVLSDSESAEQLDSAAATGADATVSGDTPPTDLTGPTMKAYKISSKPVFVPRETISDSPIDIIQEIIGALLARIIRYENFRFTKGTGSGQAEGFLTNATAYAAGAVALDLDIALDLSYNVSALYRSNGVYMCSDTTAKYLRKIKTGISGDKQQLWADADATKGTPPTLHGYPVIINNDMDSVDGTGHFAGVSPLAFGDFKKFVLRQAEQNAPYAYRYPVPAKDGGAVILFRRSDSKLIVPEAISKLTVS